MAKKYDFNKAKQVIEENKDGIVEASLGMHEDWYWTAETVFENDDFTQDLSNVDLLIGGIQGSAWATPTLKLEFKDGTERMIPCYAGESTGSQPFGLLGALSEPVQANISPLEDEQQK